MGKGRERTACAEAEAEHEREVCPFDASYPVVLLILCSIHWWGKSGGSNRDDRQAGSMMATWLVLKLAKNLGRCNPDVERIATRGRAESP